MATVKIPSQLRDAAGGQSTVRVDGETVGAVLSGLYEQHRELRDRLSDGDGGLRRFALAEALAHVEHLVGRGAAERIPGGSVRYARA